MINESKKDNGRHLNRHKSLHFKKDKCNHLLPDKNRMVFLPVTDGVHGSREVAPPTVSDATIDFLLARPYRPLITLRKFFIQ